MTAPVTVSERDLRTMLGIVQDTRDDLPEAGLPLSLLAELTDQIRCDNVSVFSNPYWVGLPGTFMQELPPVDISGVDESASDFWHWPEFASYPELTGDLRSVTKVSDFYSARQWHSTIPHTDFFRPLGCEHVLQLCLPGPLGPCSAAKMMFFRPPAPTSPSASGTCSPCCNRTCTRPTWTSSAAVAARRGSPRGSGN
jgi:hypothetical protein